MAGPRIPTDVKPNKFVEANAFAREVVENTFRFSLKNLGKFAIFGIAVPVLIYKGCVQEFVSAPPPIRISRPARPIEGGVGRSNLRRRPASSTLVSAFARRPVAFAGDGCPLAPARGNPSEHFSPFKALFGPETVHRRL